MLEVIQLYKTLENGLLFVLGNTTPRVPDVKTYFSIFRWIIADGDTSFVRIFDGIGYVVSEYLHQTVLLGMDIASFHAELCNTFHIGRHSQARRIFKFTDATVDIYISITEVQ